MPRPLSSPPFADSPGSWLAQFRLKARGSFDGPLSPEHVGAFLGVSGATVRRWESGQLLPTDEDLLHFGSVCQLSQHQIDFLRTAFTNLKAPLALDSDSFRSNTIKRLTSRRSPMIIFDELMYARAWNSYVSALGDHTLEMLRSDLHPIESFVGGMGPSELSGKEHLDRTRTAIRSFWRFTAFYCGDVRYRDLLHRLGEAPEFRDIWADLAVSEDSSEIDISGVAGLLLPVQPSFTMLHSLVVYPPVYTLIEFEPNDEAAMLQTSQAKTLHEPSVEFSRHLHWTLGPVDAPRALGAEDPAHESEMLITTDPESARTAL